MIVKVAVDLPQIEPLDYSFNTNLPKNDVVGIWVLAPLRNKLTLGLVTDVVEDPLTKFKLKKVYKVVSQLENLGLLPLL